MDNKEYLNEEEYQKTCKKLRKIGLPLLIFGAIAFISTIPLSQVSFMLGSICGFIGVPCLGIGIFLFASSKQRAMTAYYAQSQMPVAKETVEKMAPSAGAAAKEIAKGVKEGLKDDEEK